MVILYTAQTSKAESGKTGQHLKVCSVHQLPKAELACGKSVFHTHASAARWIKNHRALFTTSWAMSSQMRSELKFHLWMKRRAARWISQAHRRLVLVRYSVFPPHHRLWVCIGSIEGTPTSDTGNGHYGMLQMTYNWFGLIKGKASDYSQAVQEWAAEKAYRANNYSYSFLYGQWYKWEHGVGAKCVQYD